VTATTINFEPTLQRRCGDCQLCCKLLPSKELNKPAGTRCQHQKFGTGCAIYPTRPHACALWSCRWLTDPATADLRRPDRAHYVIDMTPDFVTVVDNASGTRTNVEVAQVWIDPKFPDAHRDPALRQYLERLGETGVAAIVRYDNRKAMTLIPPNLAADRQWHEYHHSEDEVARERTAAERFAGIQAAWKVS
jgi:hypothetical protein